jgi:2-dehydro-3-deoxyphosphogluconate aldolase/(4S)-4-hydroxy-2-oxoglutarate aldolase
MVDRSARRYAVALSDAERGGRPDVAAAATRPAIPAGISEGRIVAIGRRIDASRAPRIAEALAASGIRAFELTLNEPEADALRAIETIALAAPGLGLEVGAGTVLSIAAARRAIDAGATFLVMPHLDVELVAWAAGRGVPAFPGGATPTEILAAWTAGAAAVKLFPASSAGPGFVRELAGPFPHIPLIPTGGVTLETAPQFIGAGAIAIGMGGWLLGDGDLDGVRTRAAAVIDAVEAVAREAAARPVGSAR